MLYPDQWGDSVSLPERWVRLPPDPEDPAGLSPAPSVSEFQVKEACPPAGGAQDKPSPDSGCSLGSGPASPVQPGGETRARTLA